jgi:NAD(P)-dependent dehydrogenase (short-subunit alcohol dehydrogenase family)
VGSVAGKSRVATARREDSLADLQRKHGDRLVVPVLDLTDTAGIRAVLASAFHQLGRIDLLVSNAGYGLFGAAEEVTDAQIDHQIATNLIGPIQFIRAAIPHLRQQGGGRIVQVSSGARSDRHQFRRRPGAPRRSCSGLNGSRHFGQEVCGRGLCPSALRQVTDRDPFGRRLPADRPLGELDCQIGDAHSRNGAR